MKISYEAELSKEIREYLKTHFSKWPLRVHLENRHDLYFKIYIRGIKKLPEYIYIQVKNYLESVLPTIKGTNRELDFSLIANEIFMLIYR